jgi:hypothetical protein
MSIAMTSESQVGPEIEEDGSTKDEDGVCCTESQNSAVQLSSSPSLSAGESCRSCH